MAKELTNDHNQLSQLTRAALRLIEQSFLQLKEVAPQIQQVKRPARNNPAERERYEEILSEFLLHAVVARRDEK